MRTVISIPPFDPGEYEGSDFAMSNGIGGLFPKSEAAPSGA